MDSVQLMVLQGVYVHDVVAAGQLVSFGISTFAALVGVDGIAGVEESVAYAVCLLYTSSRMVAPVIIYLFVPLAFVEVGSSAMDFIRRICLRCV